MRRLQIYIDEELDDALAVRRSIGEPEPTLDPFHDWIGGSDATPAPIDEVVYDS